MAELTALNTVLTELAMMGKAPISIGYKNLDEFKTHLESASRSDSNSQLCHMALHRAIGALQRLVAEHTMCVHTGVSLDMNPQHAMPLVGWMKEAGCQEQVISDLEASVQKASETKLIKDVLNFEEELSLGLLVVAKKIKPQVFPSALGSCGC